MSKITELTVPAAAKRLGVSKQYLYRIIAEGKLTPRAVLKHELRIAERDVQELNRRRAGRQMQPSMKKFIFAGALAFAMLSGVDAVSTVGSAPVAACTPGTPNC